MRRTRRLIADLIVAAALLVAVAGGCGGDGKREYARNDLQLLTAYSAKELCSCAFVMGQSDDFCARWTRAAPNLKTFRIDRDKKLVETQAVLVWGARARYLGPRAGCVLEK